MSILGLIILAIVFFTIWELSKEVWGLSDNTVNDIFPLIGTSNSRILLNFLVG